MTEGAGQAATDGVHGLGLDHDPVEVALSQVGDRWTFLVLREAFFGSRRFSDIQRRLGVARNLLSQRLDALVDHGILVRVPYSERPPRSEYRLTDKGRDLYTAIVALKDWGERWGATPAADTRLVLVHEVDGGEVHARLECEQCLKAPPLHEMDYTTVPVAPMPADQQPEQPAT